MLKSFRFSLTFALLSSLACLLLLTWILLSLISFKTAERDLLEQKNEQARILLASFMAIIPDPFSSFDEKSAPGTLAGKLATESDFAGLIVIDGRGKTLFSRADNRGIDPGLRETLKTGKETFRFSRTEVSFIAMHRSAARMGFPGQRGWRSPLGASMSGLTGHGISFLHISSSIFSSSLHSVRTSSPAL